MLNSGVPYVRELEVPGGKTLNCQRTVHPKGQALIPTMSKLFDASWSQLSRELCDITV
jgi:hypothetical protein